MGSYQRRRMSSHHLMWAKSLSALCSQLQMERSLHRDPAHIELSQSHAQIGKGQKGRSMALEAFFLALQERSRKAGTAAPFFLWYFSPYVTSHCFLTSSPKATWT